jgi:hypothetical protein
LPQGEGDWDWAREFTNPVGQLYGEKAVCAIGDDDTIYMGLGYTYPYSPDHIMWALDTKSKPRWSIDYRKIAHIESFPMLSDGRLYYFTRSIKSDTYGDKQLNVLNADAGATLKTIPIDFYVDDPFMAGVLRRVDIFWLRRHDRNIQHSQGHRQLLVYQ